MATIGEYFSIAANGDIRWVGGSPDLNWTVIQLHRWFGDLMDDAQASGNDILDITDATASERSTDNFITLNPPYNIDDTVAEHLYDGSIVQDNGDTIYDGIVTFAPQGTYVDVVQNGALVTPNFWTTGINADAAQGISHRFMVKVRSGGVDIDGRRLLGQTREFGNTYSEFRINGSSRGNNVLSLASGNDLNNNTAEGTVAGWTDVVNVTEGYALLDVDNDTVNEPYFSEWDRGSRTINQFFERMKWLTRRGSISTIYGLRGDLFRGITHEVPVDTPVATMDAFGPISWSGGTGQLLAIDSPTAATKLWMQLITGVAPTDGQVISHVGSPNASVTVNGTATERAAPPLAQPFIGQSTGSALIGAYGVGLQTADLSASDLLTDLDNQQRTPPNNVTFTVNGLVSGEDYLLVTPLGYTFQYDGGGGSPSFDVGETVTFTAPAGTAVVTDHLSVDDTTGFLTISEPVTGDVPVNNSTITGGTSGQTANVNGAVRATNNNRQMVLQTALAPGSPSTTAVVVDTIPVDTPQQTTIRVRQNSGIEAKLTVLSWTGSTFTIEPFDFTDTDVGAGVYISYIDKLATAASEAFTLVFNASRNLFVRARDGGTAGDAIPIKTAETTGTLGSAGGSATITRTSDA